MGTNYYHRTNICECCGRYDERHICKSLVSFEGVVGWTHGGGWAVTVGSWADWRDRLLAEGGEVWAEEAEHIATDEFIKGVEATDPEHRRRQYEWVADHEPDRIAATPTVDRTWIDADGFSFYGGGFS